MSLDARRPSSLENWKPITNYPDYQVSTLGRIRVMPDAQWRIRKYRIPESGLIIKPFLAKGYPRVTLHYMGNKKNFSIHRLVMEAFGPAQPVGKNFVNHKNGVRHDNNLENLEWVNREENHAHAVVVLKRKMGSTWLSAEARAHIASTLRPIIESFSEEYKIRPSTVYRAAMGITKKRRIKMVA